LTERHSRDANRAYAVSRFELAQAVYNVVKPSRAMTGATGRALNELVREGHLVRMVAGQEAYWSVARHAHQLVARPRRLCP
jgi:hypothetical protein